MFHLDLMGMPIESPLAFLNGEKIIFFENYYWTVYPFIEGNYYSGSKNEFREVAIITGSLFSNLKNLPNNLIPPFGPKHLSNDDNSLINRIESMRDYWTEIFGIEHAIYMNAHWKFIKKTWQKLLLSNIDIEDLTPSHFDLHPHNIICNNSKVVGLLDFESCKQFPCGVSLAFNALKQCKQHIVYYSGKILIDPNLAFKEYKNNLASSFPEAIEYFDNFNMLSKVEIFRRLCIIFRLNIESNIKNWNHILPVQISHLYEADLLFKKQ